jgi:hypothetical protein
VRHRYKPARTAQIHASRKTRSPLLCRVPSRPRTKRQAKALPQRRAVRPRSGTRRFAEAAASAIAGEESACRMRRRCRRQANVVLYRRASWRPP